MQKKRKFESFITINRVLYWGLFILLIIFTPSVVTSIKEANTPKKVNLVDDSASRQYYDALNESIVEMDLTFDWPCSGKVTVKFYDGSDNLLSTETETFTTIGDYSTFLLSFYDVPGKVERYEITNIEAIPDEYTGGVYIYIFSYFAAAVFFAFAIASLFLKCKSYKFEGKIIVVYAGWVNHQIFEDDVLMDECRTGFYLTSIMIGYTDDSGNDVSARISTTHGISLKINNRLYKNE